MKIKIVKLKKEEIKKVAKIASENFFGLKNIKDALKWVKCNFNAFPRFQYFVAKLNQKIIGYILWVEKGGFRKESVWEIEQIAVEENYRGQGIGAELINKSLKEIKKYLKKRKSALKVIEVITGADNKAQDLYNKILGAKVEGTVKDLFRGDSIIMIARFKS